MDRPLADRIRPQELEQVVGQQHLLGQGALLRRFIEQSGKVGQALLVDDIKANARGYEILYQVAAARR